MNDILFCSHCKGAIARLTDSRCPHCAAEFSAILCPACKFVGTAEQYEGERCPRCGCRRLLAV